MLRARRPEDVLNPALAAVGTPFDSAAAAQRAAQVQQALMQSDHRCARGHRAAPLRRLVVRPDRRDTGCAIQDGEVAPPFGAAEAGRAASWVEATLMTDRREELLQARVDGELASDQRLELERLLAEDETTRLRAGELEALVETLNLLGPVDPPARVMRAVMDHVHHNAPGALPESEMTLTGGLMRTKVLWGLAAAAGDRAGSPRLYGLPAGHGRKRRRHRRSQAVPGRADCGVGREAGRPGRAGVPAKRPVRQADEGRRRPQAAERREFPSDGGKRGVQAHVGLPELKGLLDTNALADARVATALGKSELTSALSSNELAGAFANENFLRALAEPEFRLRLAGRTARAGRQCRPSQQPAE